MYGKDQQQKFCKTKKSVKILRKLLKQTSELRHGNHTNVSTDLREHELKNGKNRTNVVRDRRMRLYDSETS